MDVCYLSTTVAVIELPTPRLLIPPPTLVICTVWPQVRPAWGEAAMR
jgi:hypothetical protein